jgi:RNA polymerase sigma-70 factor (ECF subfamily)
MAGAVLTDEEQRVAGSSSSAVEHAGPHEYRRAADTPPDAAAEQAFPGFSALYERTVERLYAYLRTRTSSDEEAADLAQQIYLKALKAWPRRPRDADGQVPWLFRIGHNATTDLYRRRRQTVAWEDLPESLQPVAAQRVEDRLLRRESREHLRSLLDGLPPAKRELLALRFAARLTYAEIGGIVGKSEAATKQQILRLLSQLKDHYHER